MYVNVPRTGAVTLEDADNFRAFEVRVAGAQQSASALAVRLGAAAARVDDGHVWVSDAWLKAQGAPRGEAWLTDFGKMIGFAQKQGWVDEATQAVRAHVEWDG
jgi:hypothetical protein